MLYTIFPQYVTAQAISGTGALRLCGDFLVRQKAYFTGLNYSSSPITEQVLPVFQDHLSSQSLMAKPRPHLPTQWSGGEDLSSL